MKRIIILGSVESSFEVVQHAKKLGYYTIVVSNAPGKASLIADEFVQIDVKDQSAIIDYINTNRIDGIFTGPSEFLTKTMIDLCEITGLRCYITSKQWNICQDKKFFKELCRKFNIPCVPDYQLTKELKYEDLKKINYPVIVKPVDSYSSKGISICTNESELKHAIEYALSFSPSKNFIVEKFITNDYGFSCRYIANNGKIFLSATNDRYTVDKAGGKAMISGLSIFPSKKTKEFIEKNNQNIIAMFKSIGIRNGSFFMQALVDNDGQIYFHEMGLRLSGGLIFKMFEETCGFNDLEMMIRYAMEGQMANIEEEKLINPYFNNIITCSLTIPLQVGIIAKIEGKETIKKWSNVIEFIQYYNEGDIIKSEYIGTLSQHFGRIKIVGNKIDDIYSTIKMIHNTLVIEDVNGNNLIYKKFDINRI